MAAFCEYIAVELCTAVAGEVSRRAHQQTGTGELSGRNKDIRSLAPDDLLMAKTM